MDEVVTIGAFARMAQLSPKALRLYDELGLLPPAAVDSDTGYRYYRPAQADRARLIAWLRRLGLPLARIGEILELPRAAAAAAVQAYRAHLEAQTAERDRLADLIVGHLSGGGETSPALDHAESAGPTTAMRYAGRSEIGLVRHTNEDAVYAGPRLLAVADGVGGPAGRAASAAAIEALQSWDPGGGLLEALASVVRRAQHAVRNVADQGEAVTTLTALLHAGAGRCALVHVGDSRAYLFRRGELMRLTHDHTYVQSLVDDGVLSPHEANAHPQRALLVRALTGRASDGLDVSTRDTRRGDRYLVASDGLTAVVPDAEIRDVLTGAAGPDEAVDALIGAAYRVGAPDNIACAVADLIAQ